MPHPHARLRGSRSPPPSPTTAHSLSVTFQRRKSPKPTLMGAAGCAPALPRRRRHMCNCAQLRRAGAPRRQRPSPPRARTPSAALTATPAAVVPARPARRPPAASSQARAARGRCRRRNDAPIHCCRGRRARGGGLGRVPGVLFGVGSENWGGWTAKRASGGALARGGAGLRSFA